MWAVWTLAFLAYAALLSLAARRDAAWLEPKPVRALAVVGFFALLYLPAQALGPLLVLPVALAGAGLGVPFVWYLVGACVDGAARWATGVEAMTLRPSFDAAEKAEREGRIDDALSRYRAAAAGEPGDPEAFRRMGELLLARGERPAALDALRAALERTEDVESWCTLAFRIAELEEPARARRRLEEVARRHPGTRFEAGARARLAAGVGTGP